MTHADETSSYSRWLPLFVVPIWAAGLAAFLIGLHAEKGSIFGPKFSIGAVGLFVGLYSLRNYIWGRYRFSLSRAAIVILFAGFGCALFARQMGYISEPIGVVLDIMIGFGFLFIRWRYSYEKMEGL